MAAPVEKCESNILAEQPREQFQRLLLFWWKKSPKAMSAQLPVKCSEICRIMIEGFRSHYLSVPYTVSYVDSGTSMSTV
jgi:hypothetical protein